MLTTIKSQIKKGLEQLSYTINEAETTQLAYYVLMLEKWNKAYNLTAVKSAQEMVSRHLLDSLTLLEFITGPRIIDVGTGGGLPGIPLAIMRPEIQFTLLDANGKKTRFLQQVAFELQLDNVTVVQSRVQQFMPDPLFNEVVTRAYANLPDIISSCQHLILLGVGRILAQKSTNTHHETDQINDTSWQLSEHTTQAPGLEWPAKILILQHCSFFAK